MPIRPLLVVLLWCGLAVGAPAGGDLLTGREFLDVFMRRTQPHYSDNHNVIPHKGEHDQAFDDDLDQPTTTDLSELETDGTTTEVEGTTTEGPTTLIETTRIERSTTEADWQEHPSQVVSVRVSSSVVRARPDQTPQHEDKTVSVSYRVEAKIADSIPAASQVVEEVKSNRSDYAQAEALTYHRVKLGDDPAHTPVSYETSVSSASSGSSVRFYRQPPSYNFRQDDRQQRNFRDQAPITDVYPKTENVFEKSTTDFLKTDYYGNGQVDYSKPEFSKPQEDFKIVDHSSQSFTKPPQDFSKQPALTKPEQDFRESSIFGKRQNDAFAKPYPTPLPEYSKPPIFHPTESYIKKDQQFSKSEQVFTKPEVFPQPEQLYAKPEQVYGKPEQVYGKPEQVYGKPEQVYGKPEEVYGKPEQVYGKPEQVYGKPEQVYGKPEQVYGKPEQVYGKPEQVYGKAEQVYGKPEGLYEKPEQVYGKPEEIYGKREQAFRKPDEIYAKTEQVYGKQSDIYNKPEMLYGTPEDVFGKSAQLYAKGQETFTKPENDYTKTVEERYNNKANIYVKPDQPYQKSEEAFTKSEEAFAKGEENFGKREPDYRKSQSSYTVERRPEELPKPERIYGEPERVYGEPEQNYEIDEAVSVATNGRAHGVQEDPKDKHKFGYVVEERNYRKYRVEERTADGFIVGEYGVVSHDDGSLRGVRYTADSNINPRLIYDALVKFLSLK